MMLHPDIGPANSIMLMHHNNPWAKLQRDDIGQVVSWHSLINHSADVAAVMESLFEVPSIARRFAHLSEQDTLGRVTISRLCGLAFLHDIGKANKGFQSRWKAGSRGAGHIRELAWLLRSPGEPLRDAALDALKAPMWESWFADRSWPLFDAVFAHHGRPWNTDNGAKYTELWTPDETNDPISSLRIMGDHLLKWFPDAFEDTHTLPQTPAFHHAFAGLLMLADWLGSDTAFFEYSNGSAEDRMALARPAARRALEKIGLNIEALRYTPRAAAKNFAAVFGFEAHAVQRVVRTPQAPCIVLESETGSGKTEAALWRFLHLFEAGAVDGMYFALPTRVAATQAYQRINRFADDVFGPDRPAVMLAVPGQVQADGVAGYKLPDFGFAWDDDPDDAVRQSRWAATHPKRFLATQIAVGTIDQALLGGIRTRHAHMRGTMLLRQLLVVDEVHASDRYMETLLTGLLRTHLGAGGHALLLSATLGAGARARLLGTKIPDIATAQALPYPALSWPEHGCLQMPPIEATDSPVKIVGVSVQPCQDEPSRIVALALEAARAGAKVLVIRNTVGGAIAAQRALEALAPEALLFRVNGVPAPHHGRFAIEDRVLLDRAVEVCFGKQRPAGGNIVIGTQTLEVSLDIDADILITDLCPADVLLQRIGRLHRHHGRGRPLGFAAPRAIVLTPTNRDLLAMARRGRHGLGAVYEDLRIIEATLRLVETHPVWQIPAMNRMLVERATHPDILSAIEQEFLAIDRAWQKKLATVEGEERSAIQQAVSALLDYNQPFDELRFDADERVATRLGAADRLVIFEPMPGPFGARVSRLSIPHRLLPPNAADIEASEFNIESEGFCFALGSKSYRSNRFGITIPD